MANFPTTHEVGRTPQAKHTASSECSWYGNIRQKENNIRNFSGRSGRSLAVHPIIFSYLTMATRPNPDPQKRSTANKATSSVLSRASVYAPLKAYDFPADSERTSSIPRNLQDASLHAFFGKVSEHFHRTIPRLDCKNTAGRPLSTADIAGRIKQRSLTLVGGGHNVSATAVGKAQKQSKPTIASRSQRRRKRDRLLQRIGCTRPFTEYQLERDAYFLQQLIAEWNSYASEVLRVRSEPDSEEALSRIAFRASQLADSIEWIGARVRVAQCPSMRGREGLSGVMVSRTTNTWRIVPTADESNTESTPASTEEINAALGPEMSSGDHPWRLKPAVSVPKVGSALVVFIRIDPERPPGKPRYVSITLEERTRR